MKILGSLEWENFRNRNVIINWKWENEVVRRSFIAAIDQGATGTKFSVFNEDGSIVAICSKEHRQIYS